MWFTDEGKILAGIMFMGVMVSSPGLQISAYLLPSFILTLFMTTIFFAYFSKPTIVAKRLLPSPPTAGDFYVYQVIIKNIGRRPLRNLKICEDVLPYGLYDAPDHLEHRGDIDWLEPNESATIQLVIRCKWRGMYELPRLLIGSSFPSGLIRWPVYGAHKQHLIVYPKFVTQTNFLVPYQRMYQPGGIAISSHVGDSTEFLSTREYRSGDRMRDIHWSSYARTGKLIVKEYVDEYFVRVGLLVDTQQFKSEKDEIFEKRISMTAGVADAIAKKDYIIDLFAAGDILHHFQMGRALAHLENLLELLACIEPVKKIQFNQLKDDIKPYIKKLSSLIILLGDWDDERAALCRQLEMLGLEIRVLIIRQHPLTQSADRNVTIITDLEKETTIT